MIIICESFILSMIFFEYKKYRMATTPAILLGGVYLLFIPVINSIGSYLGFLPLTEKTIISFTMFLLVLFIGGQFWAIYYRSGKRYEPDFFSLSLLDKEKIIWRGYVVGLIAYVISLLQVIEQYGIENTKSNAFGIFAHIGFISRCFLPVIIYYAIKRKKIKYVFALIINITALIMFKGKYHIYIPVASFVVLYLITKKNIKISGIIKAVSLTFMIALMLFVSVYTIIPNILAGDTSLNEMKVGIQFSVKHFFHYFFCPFISSNEYFDNPCYSGISTGLRIVFNPIDRLYQWISGSRDYFDPAITLWPIIDTSGNTGNVGGIFSETVFNIGYLGTTIYVFFIGFFLYYFLSQTIYRGKRILSSTFLLGMLLVSFFCNYFTLLPNLECFIICYLADVCVLDNRFVLRNLKLFKGCGLLKSNYQKRGLYF